MTIQQAITAIRERSQRLSNPDFLQEIGATITPIEQDVQTLLSHIDDQQAEIVRLRAVYEVARHVNDAYVGLCASDDTEVKQSYTALVWETVNAQYKVFEELDALAAGDGVTTDGERVFEEEEVK